MLPLLIRAEVDCRRYRGRVLPPLPLLPQFDHQCHSFSRGGGWSSDPKSGTLATAGSRVGAARGGRGWTTGGGGGASAGGGAKAGSSTVRRMCAVCASSRRCHQAWRYGWCFVLPSSLSMPPSPLWRAPMIRLSCRGRRARSHGRSEV